MDPKPIAEFCEGATLRKEASDFSDLVGVEFRIMMPSPDRSATLGLWPFRYTSQMLPVLAFQDVLDGGCPNGILVGDSLVCPALLSLEANDFQHIFFLEPRLRMRESLGRSPLADSICNIVSVGATNKMVRVDAERRVAGVENQDVSRKPLVVRQFPRNTTDGVLYAAVSDPAILELPFGIRGWSASGTSPQPTLVFPSSREFGAWN